jgi:hypothetical protein
VRFIVDTQLPDALAAWLREQGHQAEHVLEIGLAQSKDRVVWRYAQEQGAVIVTKDEDFAEWVRVAVPVPLSFGCASVIAPIPRCAHGWNRCCLLLFASWKMANVSLKRDEWRLFPSTNR